MVTGRILAVFLALASVSVTMVSQNFYMAPVGTADSIVLEL